MLGTGPDNDIACPELGRSCHTWALEPVLELGGKDGARGGFELQQDVLPASLGLHLAHSAVPSLPCVERKWFDCPKSPSGLVIPVDGAELAGSFVSEQEDRLMGSCCLPGAGSTFAERPPSPPGVSASARSLLPQAGPSRQAESGLYLPWNSLPSWAELPEPPRCQEPVSVEPQPEPRQDIVG